MIEHGGRLNAAVRRTGIPRGRWLDLSTGINPVPWPVPELPPRVWQRLPEPDDGLVEVIRDWSGAPSDAAVVPLPGSQAGIQRLPRLRRPGRVGIPAPSYAEHGLWWRRAGHQVVEFNMADSEDWIDQLDVLVCINPNNPTGNRIDPDVLLDWHRRLARRDGWLVVDEAFMDGYEGASLVPRSGPEGLVVLRSLGKFFGLAGVRAGSLFGPAGLCEELSEALGPWALSHPARQIMRQALQDTAWQQRTLDRLGHDTKRLQTLLTAKGLEPTGGTWLFQYCPHASAKALAEALELQAVLVRTFTTPPALRFGLPGTEAQWRHLEKALASLGLPG